MKTVAVATLGCKVNQYESAAFLSCFAENGFALVPVDTPADIYVVNTCAVTAKAEAQSRQLIRRVQRANPGARIVVTGGYAQIAPEIIRGLKTGPLSIVGNANKHQVFEAAIATGSAAEYSPLNRDNAYFYDITAQKDISPLPVKRFTDRTRAFLKIQDGCNNFCSYCVVPYARGRSRSLASDKVLLQARLFAEEGHREIVLTGIHVGDYGRDFTQPAGLLALLKKLTAATPQIRYRISSLEPTEISRDLLDFMGQTENCMPHLHIPLQSGSDFILKKMNRRYTAEQFSELVNSCKKMIPWAAIGVDVLAGFPGEAEDDFRQTYELLEKLPVTYLHVFPYSKRPGTPAAKMKQQVPQKIKEERVAALRKLDHKKRTAFYGNSIGRVHPVLVESDKSNAGFSRGFTDNYIPVHFKAASDHGNRILPVRLESLQGRLVIGTLL